MRKNGFFLATETLKIVIAVICIAILAYFLFSLYSSNKDNKDLIMAKAALPKLIEEVNGNAKTINIETDIQAPKGWMLMSWPMERRTFWLGSKELSVPLSCYNLGWKSCICMCRDYRGWAKDKVDVWAMKCNEMGYCEENIKGIIVKSSALEYVWSFPIPLLPKYTPLKVWPIEMEDKLKISADKVIT